MEIKTLSKHSCEPCISSRDSRYELLIDNKIKVQAVQSHDKDSKHLGDIKIEAVTYLGEKYWPSNFGELPEKYSYDILEEIIYNYLN